MISFKKPNSFGVLGGLPNNFGFQPKQIESGHHLTGYDRFKIDERMQHIFGKFQSLNDAHHTDWWEHEISFFRWATYQGAPCHSKKNTPWFVVYRKDWSRKQLLGWNIHELKWEWFLSWWEGAEFQHFNENRFRVLFGIYDRNSITEQDLPESTMKLNRVFEWLQAGRFQTVSSHKRWTISFKQSSCFPNGALCHSKKSSLIDNNWTERKAVANNWNAETFTNWEWF